MRQWQQLGGRRQRQGSLRETESERDWLLTAAGKSRKIRVGYCILAPAKKFFFWILAVGLDYVARSDLSHRSCRRKSQLKEKPRDRDNVLFRRSDRDEVISVWKP